MSDPSALSINAGSPEPIYRQLMEQLRRRVASGALVAGQEVPSVRELALALAINPMTVSKAYSLLEAEGLLERRRGLAMVVAAKHQQARSQAERMALLRPALQQAAEAARQLEVEPRDALALFKTILHEEP